MDSWEERGLQLKPITIKVIEDKKVIEVELKNEESDFHKYLIATKGDTHENLYKYYVKLAIDEGAEFEENYINNEEENYYDIIYGQGNYKYKFEQDYIYNYDDNKIYCLYEKKDKQKLLKKYGIII